MSWNGKKGDNITIQQVGTGNDLIFNAGGSGFSITNLWGAIDITGSTTTTTTVDTTDKDGGDDAEPCGLWDDPCFDTSCFSSCYDERTERNWQSDRSDLMEYEALKKEEVRRDIQESGRLILGLVGFLLSFLNVGLGYLGRILGGVSLASDIEKSVRKLSDKELYKKIGAYETGIDDKNSKYYWMFGGFSPIADVIGVCYSLCCGTSGGSGPRDPKANCL